MPWLTEREAAARGLVKPRTQAPPPMPTATPIPEVPVESTPYVSQSPRWANNAQGMVAAPPPKSSQHIAAMGFTPPPTAAPPQPQPQPNFAPGYEQRRAASMSTANPYTVNAQFEPVGFLDRAGASIETGLRRGIRNIEYFTGASAADIAASNRAVDVANRPIQTFGKEFEGQGILRSFYDNPLKAAEYYGVHQGLTSLAEMVPAGAALAVPAAAAGPYGVMAAQGVLGGGADYVNTAMSIIQEAGYNPNDAGSLQQAFNDPNLMSRLRSAAGARAAVVGGINAASGGISSALLGNPAKQAVGRTVGGAVKALALDTALEGAGELGGQMAQGAVEGDWTKRVDPNEVLGEMIGGVGPGIAEVGSVALSKAPQAPSTMSWQDQVRNYGAVPDESKIEQAQEFVEPPPLPPRSQEVLNEATQNPTESLDLQLREKGVIANDQENLTGIPSEVGVGQEPVQAESQQTAGTEETPAGGILQAQEEVAPAPQVQAPTQQPLMPPLGQPIAPKVEQPQADAQQEGVNWTYGQKQEETEGEAQEQARAKTTPPPPPKQDGGKKYKTLGIAVNNAAVRKLYKEITGLDYSYNPGDAMTFTQNLKEADAKGKLDPEYISELVTGIRSGAKETLSRTDIAALKYELHRIIKESESLTGTSKETIKRKQLLEARLLEVRDTIEKGGTEQARAFVFRQATVFNPGKVEDVIAQATIAAKRDLKPEERARIEKRVKKYNEAQELATKVAEKKAEKTKVKKAAKAAEADIKKKKSEMALTGKMTPEQRVQKMKEVNQAVEERLAKQRAEIEEALTRCTTKGKSK